jgi:hypothetical protein
MLLTVDAKKITHVVAMTGAKVHGDLPWPVSLF